MGVLNLLVVMGYALTTFLTIRWMINGSRESSSGAGPVMLGITIVAALHAVSLTPLLTSSTPPNLALGTTLSVAALIIVLLFLITCLRRPLTTLGVLVLPAAGLASLIGWVLPGPAYTPFVNSVSALTHMLIACLAYGLLSLAVAQSLLLVTLEKLIRRRHPAGFLVNLPPMETMEDVLFHLIYSGFVLLTITLISGVIFSEQLFGRALLINHHVILALLAWLSFAALVIGRKLFGWRGRTAVNWTLTSFVLLVLGYFGSRVVLEIILATQ